MRSPIVDDDVVVSRNLLHEILQEYGEVETASNGADALKIFLKKKFDLVCLDLSMPQLDGHEVLTYFRAYEKLSEISLSERVKVLITSVTTDPGNLFQAFREAADGYLAKPFNIDNLVAYLGDFNLINTCD